MRGEEVFLANSRTVWGWMQNDVWQMVLPRNRPPSRMISETKVYSRLIITLCLNQKGLTMNDLFESERQQQPLNPVIKPVTRYELETVLEQAATELREEYPLIGDMAAAELCHIFWVKCAQKYREWAARDVRCEQSADFRKMMLWCDYAVGQYTIQKLSGSA